MKNFKLKLNSFILILMLFCNMIPFTYVKAASCHHLNVTETMQQKDVYTNDLASHCYDRIVTTKSVCKSCNAVVTEAITNVVRVWHDIRNTKYPQLDGSMIYHSSCKKCNKYSEIVMFPFHL